MVGCSSMDGVPFLLNFLGVALDSNSILMIFRVAVKHGNLGWPAAHAT